MKHTCINTGTTMDGSVMLPPCPACQERTVEALRSAHGALVQTVDARDERIAALEAARRRIDAALAHPVGGGS